MSRVSTSSQNPRRKWDPREVLDLYPNKGGFTCVGTTQRGLRCRNAMISSADLSKASTLLDELSLHSPNHRKWVSQLKEIAALTLCPRWHRRPGYCQVSSVTKQWTILIKDYGESLTESVHHEDQRLRQEQTDSDASELVDILEENCEDVAIIKSCVSRILDRSTLAELEEDLDTTQLIQQLKRIRRNLTTTIRCFEDLSDSNSVVTSRSSTRRSAEHQTSTRTRATPESSTLPRAISSTSSAPSPFGHSVPQSSSQALTSSTRQSQSQNNSSSPFSNNVTNTFLNTTDNGQAIVQASVLVTASTTSSSAEISVEITGSPNPASTLTSVTTPTSTSLSTSTDTTTSTSTSPSTSSATPSSTSSSRSASPSPPTSPTQPTTVSRRPLIDPCIVCTEIMHDLRDTVWCRAQCGQNFHHECFSEWRSSQESQERELLCMYCRTPWLED